MKKVIACLVAITLCTASFTGVGWAADADVAKTEVSSISIVTEDSQYSTLAMWENMIHSVQGKSNQTEARKILDMVNTARTAEGTTSLTWDESLEAAALQRAAEASFDFSHTRPDGSSFSVGIPQANYLGENIASGFLNAQSVNAGWTASPGHYANMINTNYQSFAAACFEKDGGYYWVEIFSSATGSGIKSAANNDEKTWDFNVRPGLFSKIFTDVSDSDWFVKEGYLQYVKNTSLMGGYSDEPKFGPYDSITRGQVATILYRYSNPDAEDTTISDQYAKTNTTGLTDVETGAFYTAAVNWAKEKDVITGYASGPNRGKFLPYAPVSREELATMIARFVQLKNIDTSGADDAAFNAIEGHESTSEWAKEALVWCCDKKIIGGKENSDGTFSLDPQGSAWRSAMAKIMTITLYDVLGDRPAVK